MSEFSQTVPELVDWTRKNDFSLSLPIDRLAFVLAIATLNSECMDEQQQGLPVKLAKVLFNPLFPALDSQLRSGRHIGIEELDNHAFLMDFQEERRAPTAATMWSCCARRKGSFIYARVLPL